MEFIDVGHKTIQKMNLLMLVIRPTQAKDQHRHKTNMGIKPKEASKHKNELYTNKKHNLL
jgi:hypothetical protein